MLDFICMIFAELLSTGYKRKILNLIKFMIWTICTFRVLNLRQWSCIKWLCMPLPGIEPAIPCFPACPSNQSAIGAVDDMWIKLLQYLFTILQELCVMCKGSYGFSTLNIVLSIRRLQFWCPLNMKMFPTRLNNRAQYKRLFFDY